MTDNRDERNEPLIRVNWAKLGRGGRHWAIGAFWITNTIVNAVLLHHLW